MKTVSSATWILAALLAIAFILDLSGLTARMPNGGSFFLGSVFAIGFLIGGAALLRFGLVRRPFRRLWAWVTIVLLYFSFFVIRAGAFQDDQYRPSLLFVLCLIAAFRILRTEGKTQVSAATDAEGPVGEPPSLSPEMADPAAPAAIAALRGRESEPECVVPPENSSPNLSPRHGRVWTLVVMALLAVAAIIFEIRNPSASFKLSNFGILLGGMFVGGSIRFLYSGCWHFEGSRFGPGIAALVWGVVGIGVALLIQSVPEAGLDFREILSFHEGDGTLGFLVAGLAGFSMASWLGEPSLDKTTSRLLLIGASVGLGVLFLGLWLDQITVVKTSEADSSTAVSWRIETFDGREYVSDRNIVEFYRFESLENEDGVRVFRHPNLLMAWVVGRPTIRINQVEIGLKHPIVERQGTAFLSTVDLAKIVEPIIRPGNIRTTAEFDVVVISLGGQTEASDSVGTSFLDDLVVKEEFATRGIAVEFAETLPGGGKRSNTTGRQEVHLDIRLIQTESGSPASLSTFAIVAPDSASQGSVHRQQVRDLEGLSLAVAIHSRVMGLVRDGGKRLALLEEDAVVDIDAPMVRVVIESSKLSGDTPEEQRRELTRELSRAVADGIIRWRSALKPADSPSTSPR
jgi:hypothetical protein